MAQNFTNSENPNAQYGVPLNPDGSIMTPDDRARQETYYGGRQGVAEADVARARAKAEAAAGRSAYQTNLGQSDASRGYQNNALDYLNNAALGATPSAAEIQSKQATDAAIRGGQSMAATIKGGPGARVAAARFAQQNAAQTAATGAQSAAMLRAKEMEAARTGLAQSATATRTNDLAASGLQQQSELAQRQLNQQGEQFFEGQGTGIRTAEMEAAARRRQQESNNAIQERQNKLKEEQQGWDKTKDIFSMASGAVNGVASGAMKLFSDERTKYSIQPLDLGPLNSLGLGGVGGSVDIGGKGSFDANDVKAASTGLVGQSGGIVGGGGITGGGSSSYSDSSGSPVAGPVMVSDDRAKLAAAWDEGHQAAARDVEKLSKMPPEKLKAMKDNPLAQALRGAKADAWDEGQGAPPDVTKEYVYTPAPNALPPPQAKRPAASMGARPAASSTIDRGEVQRGGLTPQQAALDEATLASLGVTFTRPERETTTSDERAKETAGDAAMAGANRSMEPKVYYYKPEYAEKSGQQPGEVNVGPIAQSMAKDPVARTAVVKTDDGMLGIDKDKGLKLVMGGLAALQDQVDSLKKRKSA